MKNEYNAISLMDETNIFKKYFFLLNKSNKETHSETRMMDTIKVTKHIHIRKSKKNYKQIMPTLHHSFFFVRSEHKRSKILKL